MKPNDEAYQAARAAILKAMAERNCIIAGVPFNENNTNEFDAGEAAEHAKVALDAAYAAQFKSEDYAGLVKELREWDHCWPSYSIEQAVPKAADALEAVLAELNNKPKPSEEYAGLMKDLRAFDEELLNAQPHSCEQTAKQAADALEAVLADRESALAAANGRVHAAELHAAGMSTQRDIAIRERDSLKAELAAANKRAANRLAVEAERDALAARLAPVEDEALVEIAAKEMDRVVGFSMNNVVYARNAIAAIRPHIEAAERERCAKTCRELDKQAEAAGAAYPSGIVCALEIMKSPQQ